jgi:hypothetical protein
MSRRTTRKNVSYYLQLYSWWNVCHCTDWPSFGEYKSTVYITKEEASQLAGLALFRDNNWTLPRGHELDAFEPRFSSRLGSKFSYSTSTYVWNHCWIHFYFYTSLYGHLVNRLTFSQAFPLHRVAKHHISAPNSLAHGLNVEPMWSKRGPTLAASWHGVEIPEELRIIKVLYLWNY